MQADSPGVTGLPVGWNTGKTACLPEWLECQFLQLSESFGMASWKRAWPVRCTVCLTEWEFTVNT
jgi:hypothetical protein